VLGEMKRDIYLSIIMPAYDEEEVIYKNLLIVADVTSLIAERYEIICIDDGSHDNTAEQAELAAAQNEYIHVHRLSTNQGKGNALRIGTAAANGNLIMFLDSDLDLSPSTIVDFLDIMDEKGVDIVIGSKLHPNSKISYPAVRRLISYTYYIFIRFLFHLKIRDTQTGMKLFKADVIKPVMKKAVVKRFAFDIEILSIMNREGFKISDAPIILEYGRSVTWGRIDLKTIMNVFLVTLNIYYNLYILKYYDRLGENAINPEKDNIR
jgi:glycosyltransferase involved in cell wall biosynthesis